LKYSGLRLSLPLAGKGVEEVEAVSVEVDDDEVGVLLVLVLAGRLRDAGFGSGVAIAHRSI
jgi:hypothetical protein